MPYGILDIIPFADEDEPKELEMVRRVLVEAAPVLHLIKWGDLAWVGSN
jgi:hypothetical protein